MVLASAGPALGLVVGDPLGVLGGALVQVPAVWVPAGVGVLVLGVLPRTATPLLVVLVLAAALVGTGLAGLRRRAIG